MHSDPTAEDTVLDGKVSDVLDTKGEYGRALIAATTIPHGGKNPEGVILWAEGSVYHDCTETSTYRCDESMGDPERAGLWVWEGTLRLVTHHTDYGDEPDISYEGTWREATPMEVCLFQDGRSPFEKVSPS